MSSDSSASDVINTIFLDCDSTLTRVEGIDELGIRAGVGQQLAELTRAAMDGEIALDQVYAKRLELARPNRAAIEWLGRRYVEQMVPGARRLVDGLTALGKGVYVVSGGLAPAVEHLAGQLGIPRSNVFAVPIFFGDQGDYAGFDQHHPLARASGKADICRDVMRKAPAPSAIVGDGRTDMEAAIVCDLAIGFGGVVSRENVRDSASVFVESPTLDAVLRALVSEMEWARLRALGLAHEQDLPSSDRSGTV